MWLLNTSTRQLQHFIEHIPTYVILSHTWAQEEVTFDDIGKSHALDMEGYKKILGCCELALRDGFKWAWIDTCCIDKRSSAELSEAINSIYKWYWQAAICYAYLSDVESDQAKGRKTPWRPQLDSSRWFRRGWTLQELLSPDTVEFYDQAWRFLGTKTSLISALERVTKIDRKFILDRTSIKYATIGTKLSWAAYRQTTRSEDIAYCLLGLVGVNMPMLYGKGHRAFHRLQLEIVRQSNDHTIFAWEPYGLDWRRTSVLAATPRCFAQSSRFERSTLRKSADATSFQTTNNGLSITLPIIALDARRSVALLDCRNQDGNIACIWLDSLGNDIYHRLPASKLTLTSSDEEADATLLQMYLSIEDNLEDEIRLPSRLSIASIRSESWCRVEKITRWSQDNGSLSRETILLDESADMKYEYLLGQTFAWDGEPTAQGRSRETIVNPVTTVLLRCGGLSSEYYSIEMHFGMREDKIVFSVRRSSWARTPALGHVLLEQDLWDQTWQDVKSGAYDLVGDYQRERVHPYCLQFEAWVKKTETFGTSCWTITIKLWRCPCYRQAECSCAINDSELKELCEHEGYSISGEKYKVGQDPSR